MCRCKVLAMILCLQLGVNPFTAPGRKISGLKSAHIHSCKQYIGWSYNKSTFSVVHFDRAQVKGCVCGGGGGGGLDYFKFGTFICRFLSYGAASTAVKWLMFSFQRQ